MHIFCDLEKYHVLYILGTSNTSLINVCIFSVHALSESFYIYLEDSYDYAVIITFHH